MTALTPEQIKQRRGFIGGSDALAIVTGDWRRLWRIKTGRDEPEDLSWNIPVQIGIATEELNCRIYESATGSRVTNRGELWHHRAIPYLAANLDGMTTTAIGRDAYIDFKWCARIDDARTIRYTAQCTHCAIITDADWWQLSVLTGVGKWELIEQEVDPFFAQDYLAHSAEFWGYVVRGQEPPEDMGNMLSVPKPAPAIKLRTVDLSNDSARRNWPNWGRDMTDSLGKWFTTYAAHKAHEVARREVKELMPEDVGTVLRGRIKAARDKAGAVRISLTKGEEE